MPSSPPARAISVLAAGRIDIEVGGRAVVALVPADRKVRVGLVIPALDRVVDVSVQPTTVCHSLDDAAAAAHVPATAVDAAARDALREAAARGGAWTPAPGMCLSRAFGGIAFPLLAAAYDAGGSPVGHIPRWAAPILAAPTVGLGATTAFGRRATRPVRRALVEAIRPLTTGEIDLTLIALALMARDVLQPDRLARLLRCERVRHPAGDLPDPATVEAARTVCRHWGDLRTERIMIDAAARTDGLRLMLDTVHYAQQLGDNGPPSPLPNRLAALHDAHRALMRSRTSARTAERPPSCRRRAAEAPSPPLHDAMPHRALAPPAAIAPVTPETALSPPLAIRSLDGRGVGDLTFIVPRVAGDLARWGRLLSNCLGDFGPAAAAGRSHIIGVQRANRLIYAIELTPAGTVRQFCGRANLAPNDQDRRAIHRALADLLPDLRRVR